MTIKTRTVLYDGISGFLYCVVIMNDAELALNPLSLSFFASQDLVILLVYIKCLL
jgi:hypothetical protein